MFTSLSIRHRLTFFGRVSTIRELSRVHIWQTLPKSRECPCGCSTVAKRYIITITIIMSISIIIVIVMKSTNCSHCCAGKLAGKLMGHSIGISHLATLPISSALAIVTCDISGKWCLWDLNSRDCVISGKEVYGCSTCAFTPRIPSLSPPRPLVRTQ